MAVKKKKTKAEKVAQAERILRRLHERAASGAKGALKTYGSRAAIADYNIYKNSTGTTKRIAKEGLNGDYYKDTQNNPQMFASSHRAEARQEYNAAKRLGLDKRVEKSERNSAKYQARKAQGLSNG